MNKLNTFTQLQVKSISISDRENNVEDIRNRCMKYVVIYTNLGTIMISERGAHLSIPIENVIVSTPQTKKEAKRKIKQATKLRIKERSNKNYKFISSKKKQE